MSDSVRPHRRQPGRFHHPWDSLGKNTGVGCHFLLQFMKVKVKSLSCVWLFATPWTAAYQAVPSMGFSRQEYWRGVPLPSPLGSRAQGQYLWYMGLAASWHVGSTWIRDWPMSPALVSGFFTTEPPGKPDIENLLYSRRCTRPLE